MPPSRSRLAAHAWWAYLALAAVATICYYLAPRVSKTGEMYTLIGLSGAVAVVVGVRLHGPSRRLPWYLFAGSQALFAAGDAVYYTLPDLFHGFAPTFPCVADIFYVFFYPTIVAGLMLLIRARSPQRDRAALVDALIVGVGVGVVSWIYLMVPFARDQHLPLGTKALSIAYPVMDVVVLAVTIRLAIGAGRRAPVLALLVAGLISVVLADAVSMFTLLQLNGSYTKGSWVDAGWLAFYVTWGAAALHPSMRSLSERVADPPRGLGRGRLLILTGATLMSPAVQLTRVRSGTFLEEGVLVVASILLFLLVVLRLRLVVRQHQESESRERALREAGAALVSAPTIAATRAAAIQATRQLAGAGVEVLISDLDDDGGDAAETVPPGQRRIGQLDSTLHALPTPAVDELVAGRSVRLDEVPAALRGVLGVSPGSHLVVAPLSAGSVLAGLLTVAARRPLDQRTLDGIDALASQVALALEARRLAEDLNRSLAHRAFHDPITSLANRALFHDRLRHALDLQGRNATPLAVVAIDLDDFKDVNDSLGHAAGDQLLARMGERLRASLRASDTAARLGGDEFALLLEQADARGAGRVAEAILESLTAPFTIEGHELFLNASLGIAVSDPAGSGGRAADDLLRDADRAMYVAKERGKGGYQVFEPGMHRTAVRRLELTADLHRALDNRELRLVYQPLLELRTGRIVGVEALVRWDHPVAGLMPPGQFIPLAEDCGLMVPIGRWVLTEACRQACALRDAAPEGAPPLTMAVNLSARQLQHTGLVAEVRTALEASGTDPATLVLEVTESMVVRDPVDAAGRLHELKRLGVRIAVDDFGTGRSSLDDLRQLPLDILKIDRSFVERVDRAPAELAIAGAIVHLGNALGLEVVAEGIETAGQLRHLIDLGVDLGAGYHLGRPMDPRALAALLEREAGHVAAAAGITGAGTPS